MKLLRLVFLFGLCALAPAAFAGPVDINSADAASLDRALKGVGPKTAAAIVDYRKKQGPFKSVDDLAKVNGIGPALIEKNRANMTVGSANAATTSGAAIKASTGTATGAASATPATAK